MKLIIDNSEPLGIVDQFASLKYDIHVLDITKQLEMSGDYYFKCDYGEIMIERKTISDFDGSMSDGSIFDQCERMQIWSREGENRLVFIITIGPTNEFNEHAGVNYKSRVGAMNSIQMRYGIPVNNYTTEEDFIWAVHKLCRSLNEGKMGEYRVTDLSKYKNPDGTRLDKNDPMSFFIQAFANIPGISIGKAKKIVETLIIESVNDILIISYDQLIELDGIGPTTAIKILHHWGVFHD